MRSLRRLRSIYETEGVRSAIFIAFDTGTKRILRVLFHISFIRHTVLSEYLLRMRFQLYMLLCPNCTDADPLKRVWVDPEEIEYYYSGEPQRFGHVEDGNWDKAETRFEDTEFYRFLEQRYIEGREWQETELYQQWRQEIAMSIPDRRFETLSELSSYLDYVDGLYNKIDREGYKSQMELLRKSPSKVWKANNDALHPLLNEVAVNIDRDGRMGKKSSGKHRLAIAKILGVDEIPVVVRVRHSEWQAVRIQLKNNKTSIKDKKQLYDHPDLRDIS